MENDGNSNSTAPMKEYLVMYADAEERNYATPRRALLDNEIKSLDAKGFYSLKGVYTILEIYDCEETYRTTVRTVYAVFP